MIFHRKNFHRVQIIIYSCQPGNHVMLMAFLLSNDFFLGSRSEDFRILVKKYIKGINLLIRFRFTPHLIFRKLQLIARIGGLISNFRYLNYNVSIFFIFSQYFCNVQKIQFKKIARSANLSEFTLLLNISIFLMANRKLDYISRVYVFLVLERILDQEVFMKELPEVEKEYQFWNGEVFKDKTCS